MVSANEIKMAFLESLSQSESVAQPYTHWLLSDCLTEETVDALASLPFDPPAIGDTEGKRATNNDSRIHFGPEYREHNQVMNTVAQVFQDEDVTKALESHTGATLSGMSLRIEYCQDTADFWLEPHTDIGVKKFTMLIYLNRESKAEDWGTDVYAGPDAAKDHVGAAPAGFNRGLIFVPGDNTWHGFEKRPIDGIRKSIIVNYVTPEWRNRDELCYPEQPVQ